MAEELKRRLTKYDRVHAIGVRAEQLAQGAQAFVPIPPIREDERMTNRVFYRVAEEELRQHKMPFKIERRLPDGTTARINIVDD